MIRADKRGNAWRFVASLDGARIVGASGYYFPSEGLAVQEGDLFLKRVKDGIALTEQLRKNHFGDKA